MLAVYIPLAGYMGFAVRSRASRRPHIYPYYHCNRLNSTFKMESSVRRLQSIFGRKRDNRSTCHLFSQDTDITSRSVSNRSTSTSKLGAWSLLKVPVIFCSSFNDLMAESYLLCLFCFAMVCRWTVRHSTVCPRPLPAKSLLSLLPVPSY